MANILATEKKIAAVSALCEGMSIRSVERISGVHRDTIMRLGVRVGEACQIFMDENLRELSCERVQVDELWGFIGKKQAKVTANDSSEVGDVWTFVSIDADTKLVPTFHVGKRNKATATAFIDDLAGRMKNRIQLSSDSLNAYVDAVERGFGDNVDFGTIVKTYTRSDLVPGRYSPPDILRVRKSKVLGNPAMRDISTSYVEKQNHTMRMHCRRLSRLTNAFSKKLENFKAAVALHFAYYNYVKTHGALKCSPAMAAGVMPGFLTVADLVEMSA